MWEGACSQQIVGPPVEGPAVHPTPMERITCISVLNTSRNALCRKRVWADEPSSTMTWLSTNPCCTISRMLAVMPNATSPHFSGKYACTILCNSMGDLSSLSTAWGILSSFHMSVKANGNFFLPLRRLCATRKPTRCSITIATPPMACTACSTCPPYLRSYSYDGTVSG
jgi:hypothetical protein